MVTLQLLHKPSLHTLFSISSPQHYQQQPSPLPFHPRLYNVPRASASSSQKGPSTGRRQLIAETAAAAAVTASGFLIGGGNKAFAAAEEGLSEWERVYLPIDPGVVLLDIAFVPNDPSHGFLLGTRQTILETKDGGNTWAPRSIPSAEEEDFNYRFNSISFKGNEGWIVGKPAILLYTSDAGENWKRIPLSSQLPGDIHHRGSGTRTIREEERPRFFDSKAKQLCWDNAETVPGRHPQRWRKDAAGNIVLKRFHGCQGCLCFEFDHILPFSKGGQSVVENCQILQTRVNRFKSDKQDLKKNQLKGYSCDISFGDNELDIIEMAVYGDVIRLGKESRCRTINEMPDKNKSMDQIAA
ncbi:uncharacterized protein [Coffea arabica]|uniref:Uncharacterized protein isoform X3 n=1 Tax=Coffea arabica TaxID=13443 RepID=A0A6P6V4S1_COFAR|nr:photosystem II stability/assembly factor HCF136, chloroplastic-like isoform X3 [Coffea arabica]